MATQQEVAEHLDLSRQQINNLLKKGVIPKAKGRNGLDLDAARLGYINYLRDRANSKTADDDDEKLILDEERAKLAREQAETAALKNAQIRREVAPIVVIEWALGKVGSQISAILASIPGKIKKRVPRLSVNEIEIIRKEIIRAQNTAAKITVELDDFKPET